jgi:hypothetical protein
MIVIDDSGLGGMFETTCEYWLHEPNTSGLLLCLHVLIWIKFYVESLCRGNSTKISLNYIFFLIKRNPLHVWYPYDMYFMCFVYDWGNCVCVCTSLYFTRIWFIKKIKITLNDSGCYNIN